MVDAISSGRLEFGIGSGNTEMDYIANSLRVVSTATKKGKSFRMRRPG
jgi:hypothetical protein